MNIYIALENIRSNYNVGSILRTADGLGASGVFTVGQTPHLRQENDQRLPHVIERAEKQILKTALGAQNMASKHFDTTTELIDYCNKMSIQLVSIEKTDDSKDISQFMPECESICIVLGNEVDGVSQQAIDNSSCILHIPMHGNKESFNVSIAGAIATYELKNKTSQVSTRSIK